MNPLDFLWTHTLLRANRRLFRIRWPFWIPIAVGLFYMFEPYWRYFRDQN